MLKIILDVIAVLIIAGGITLIILKDLAKQTILKQYADIHMTLNKIQDNHNQMNKILDKSNLPLVSCAAILNKDKVLCVTRRHQQVFGLPGGKIDPGESLEDGLSREVLEETNLHVDPKEWIKVYEFHELDDKPPYVQYWSTTFMVDVSKVSNIDELKQVEDGIIPAWLTWDEFHERGVFIEYDKAVQKSISEYFANQIK